MPNSYEHSFQHNLDDVIDASDAVLAIGTEKVDTTTLKDRSLTGNDATIHGAMPSSGYFLGRTFDGDDDYLDCGNTAGISVFYYEIIFLLNTTFVGYPNLGGKNPSGSWAVRGWNNTTKLFFNVVTSDVTQLDLTSGLSLNKLVHLVVEYDGTNMNMYVNGILVDTIEHQYKGSVKADANSFLIGKRYSVEEYANIEFVFCKYRNVSYATDNTDGFNTIARLPLYFHNFERYPNSDTSLTSVFPYTSGIITSGSFNKTDGLKCTSTGQIIFSNSFEFDGSEYITLVIDGVEYSGTTTVTQGTITATIVQGSNDITIDMGTGDVLPDIRVQFREEV